LILGGVHQGLVLGVHSKYLKDYKEKVIAPQRRFYEMAGKKYNVSDSLFTSSHKKLSVYVACIKRGENKEI